MHSLRTKITLLMIIVIMVCVVAIGAISIFSIQNSAEQISSQYMKELCVYKADEMDHFLEEIQQSVDAGAHYLTDDVSAVALVDGDVVGAVGTGDSLPGHDYNSEQQAEFDAYLHDHVEKAKLMFHSLSYNTTNTLSYFYRINPEFSLTEPGFLFMRAGNSAFEEHTPTDIFAYDSSDLGHVGWYYQTLDRGRPSWLTPYQDENLGSVVTTYITPIYKAGTFVGVAGMDISYDMLVEKIQDLDIYTTGYAFLTDEYGKIVYHPSLPYGTSLSEVNSELKQDDDSVSEDQNSSDLIEYNFEGQKKRAAWRTLSNGLRLFVSAPVSEIEEAWHSLTALILVAAVIILAVFITIITIFMRRVTDPLKRLTTASEEISKGNYDVDLPYDSKDEVGTLTMSFRHLTAHLKEYVSDLNSKAYKDALTNVKNKAALDMYSDQMDEVKPEEREYAVLLLDCNDLKKINDVYGHDKGDLYLQNSCKTICASFPRSPVFRMGGDEFVVILQNEAYSQRVELVKGFLDNSENTIASAKNPWEKVNLAMGMAVYDIDSDEKFNDVLRKADEEMYNNKKAWKEAQKSTSQTDKT